LKEQWTNEDRQLKKVITLPLQTATTKKGRQIFKGKNRGDTVSCHRGWHQLQP